MANYIPQHVAETAALRFIKSALDSSFAADLTSLYDLTADHTGTGAHVVPGVYLPAPDDWYIQSGPTNDAYKDVGYNIGYILPTSPVRQIGNASNALADGFVWQCEQDFAVTMVFGVAPQAELTIDGDVCREEEILRYRASYYAGALAHTCFARLFGNEACRANMPIQRTSDQAEFKISESSYGLLGVAECQFRVYSQQLFPAHT